MKKHIHTIFLLLAVCTAGVTSAQKISYRFEQTTAAYSNLTGATVVQNPNFGSGDFHPINLAGETFKFYNTPFPFGGIKTFHLQTNGNIRIDNDSAMVIVDGAFVFLDSIDNQSEISYAVEGAGGDKIVKVQWKNVRIRTGQAGNFINLQIWAYQKSGVIELRYGPSSASNASGFSESGPGVGPQVGMFFSRDDLSVLYEKLWIYNTPANVQLDSAKTFAFRAMQGFPPEGTVYRFVPKFSTLSVNQLISNGRHISCYPNPVTGGVLHFSEPVTGCLTDFTGRCLVDFTMAEMLDMQYLPAGVYIVTLQNGSSIKIVK